MPLINIQTPREIPSSVLAGLSKIVAETIGKPETYVMVNSSSADLMMAGSAGHAAFVEVKSIGGLTREVNEKLADKICGLLEAKLQIPPERVYLNFTEVPASQWGWNSSLFG
ncbi:MAG: phenylpyruvate tautomerase MIF-related protein [Pontiellaceae bacterium]|jgi:phenylpyruvate tautomerase PptA (4-oxalocrotonate tautomerase family)|nr:phenylpyruvate tautomerase MIF-related protein [Pontiellaceae bacterium]